MKLFIKLILFLFMISSCLGASTKIGIIADIHYSDQADAKVLVGDKGYRIYSTAGARFAAAIATWNAESVDASVSTGDAVDGGHTDPCTAFVTTFATAIGTLNDNHYPVIGNHEDGAAKIETAFFDMMEDVLPSWPADNTWYALADPCDPCDPWAYTASEGDQTLIFVTNVNGTGHDFDTTDNVPGGVDQVEWLTATLDTTSSVVFVHENPLDDPCGIGLAFRNVIEADGGVRAVFAAHDHLDIGVRDQTSIPYFDLAGSVNCNSLTDTGCNSYYIAEISTNTYLGVDQRRARIVVTKFGRGVDGLNVGWTIPADGKAFEWKFNDADPCNVPDSKGASDGTAAVAKVRAHSPITGQSIVFDGTNDYIEADDQLIDGFPFTVSAWFKTTGVQQGVIFGVVDSGQNNRYDNIRIETTGLVSISTRLGVPAEGTASSTKAYNDGLWHQITGVFETDILKTLYVDGIAVASNTTNKGFHAGIDRWSIGHFGGSTPAQKFSGEIDLVVFYPYARTANEIAKSYIGEKPKGRGRYDNVSVENARRTRY